MRTILLLHFLIKQFEVIFQVNAMVDRVSEMFPNRSREEILNVVRDTGSITGAVDYFLSRTRGNAEETLSGNNENAINQVLNNNDVCRKS